VADLAPHVLDRPRCRRRHLHRSLIRFECDQRVFRRDLVTTLHRDLDDRHILEVADVGDSHLDDFVDAGSRAVVGNWCALTGGAAALLDLLSGCEAGGRDLRLGDKDEGALGNLVADLDPDFLDHAVDRRGHLHRCLVRFQSDQRIFGLDLIARFDQHLDDRNVPEIADVGDLDVDAVGHPSFPYTRARRMAASRPAKYALKRAPAALYITRWSQESDNGWMRRGTACLPSQTLL